MEDEILEEFLLVRIAKETEYTRRWKLFGGEARYKLGANRSRIVLQRDDLETGDRSIIIGRGLIKFYCCGDDRRKVFYLEISPDAAHGQGIIEICSAAEGEGLDAGKWIVQRMFPSRSFEAWKRFRASVASLVTRLWLSVLSCFGVIGTRKGQPKQQEAHQIADVTQYIKTEPKKPDPVVLERKELKRKKLSRSKTINFESSADPPPSPLDRPSSVKVRRRESIVRLKTAWKSFSSSLHRGTQEGLGVDLRPTTSFETLEDCFHIEDEDKNCSFCSISTVDAKMRIAKGEATTSAAASADKGSVESIFQGTSDCEADDGGSDEEISAAYTRSLSFPSSEDHLPEVKEDQRASLPNNRVDKESIVSPVVVAYEADGSTIVVGGQDIYKIPIEDGGGAKEEGGKPARNVKRYVEQSKSLKNLLSSHSVRRARAKFDSSAA